MKQIIAAALIFGFSASVSAGNSRTRPSASSVLDQALAPAHFSYWGKLKIEIFSPQQSSIKGKTRVFFAAPSSFRREILGPHDQILQVLLLDAEKQHIEDLVSHKTWEGPAIERLNDLQENGLVAQNYDVFISTARPVARRSCWKLELYSKFDHTLRRQLWVDKKTGLILKSEVWNPDGLLTEEMHFIQIEFSQPPSHLFSLAESSKKPEPLLPDWNPIALPQAATVSGLKIAGPQWLPAGFVFEGINVLPKGKNNILHYQFSDGLNALSLFEYPDALTLDFGSRHPQEVKNGAFLGQLTWTDSATVLSFKKDGFQFALVGSLPFEILQKIAESIP